jgi:molybdate transport system ATP-binding protein
MTGTATAGADGLTRVALDGGGSVLSTEPGEGPVAVSLYPWEIALEPPGTEASGSALNHLPVRVVSVTAVGNRVRVGLAAPQPLTAELSDVSVRALDLRPDSTAVATWKASATRLLRL